MAGRAYYYSKIDYCFSVLHFQDPMGCLLIGSCFLSVAYWGNISICEKRLLEKVAGAIAH